jgi:small subunit ribosomal protein S18
MQRRIMKLRPVARDCIFCKEKREPDYKDVQGLTRYTSERGKLLSQARTGLCTKHQRRVARSIKHARHLAMLPFVVRS